MGLKLVDANVLIYAVDRGAANHAAAKAWLDRALGGADTILMPWVSLLAFVRLVTHPSIFEHPLTVDDAFDVVEAWLAHSTVVVPTADGRHARRLRELLTDTGRGGNLVNDAHLAALALEHGAVVITFDNDFGRFAGVRWERPAE